MVLDTSLLNTQHYKVRIKGKVEPSREGVAPSPTSWCSSYRKGSLRVTLDYGRQLYLLIVERNLGNVGRVWVTTMRPKLEERAVGILVRLVARKQIPTAINAVDRIHYTLEGTGLGRILVGRALLVCFDRVCPGSSGSRSRCAFIGILNPQGAVPPGSNPPWRG